MEVENLTQHNGMLPLSLETVRKVEERARRRGRRPGTTFTLFDQTTPRYSWLLPGWVAEERRMRTGRLYRYYYDTLARVYHTKYEVLNAWRESGIIMLDD